MNAQRLQQSLLRMLDADVVRTRRRYFDALCRWVDLMRAEVVEELALYGLDELIKDDPSSFAVDESAVDPDVEVARLHAVRFASKDSVVMWVRDQVWALVAHETQESCDVCLGGPMRVLVHGTARAPILACDMCGAARDLEGAPVILESRAGPARKSELSEMGFLPT